MDTIKTINPVEIGFGILGTAALFYVIYYFRHNIVVSKTFQNDIQNKIDDLTIKYSDLQSALSRETTSKDKTLNQGFI